MLKWRTALASCVLSSVIGLAAGWLLFGSDAHEKIARWQLGGLGFSPAPAASTGRVMTGPVVADAARTTPPPGTEAIRSSAGAAPQATIAARSQRPDVAAPGVTAMAGKQAEFTVPVPIRIVRHPGAPEPFDAGANEPSTRAATGYQLARDIQRELRRVGCWVSRVDGDWTESSRNAARQFVRNVNAALPIERPDMALLSLLQNYKYGSCGADCAPGAERDRHGICRVGEPPATTVLAPPGTKQRTAGHTSSGWRIVTTRNERPTSRRNRGGGQAGAKPPGPTAAPPATALRPDIAPRLVLAPRPIREGRMGLGLLPPRPLNGTTAPVRRAALPGGANSTRGPVITAPVDGDRAPTVVENPEPRTRPPARRQEPRTRSDVRPTPKAKRRVTRQRRQTSWRARAFEPAD